MKSKRACRTNRVLIILMAGTLAAGCGDRKASSGRIPVASAGSTILYYDQIPQIYRGGPTKQDSAASIQNYINQWARKELMLQKAEENLSPGLKEDIDRQLEETRANLVIYQYQRQMMLEKMDTVVSDSEMENYYNANQNSFLLSSGIVKALFVKIPRETPNPDRIRTLARSGQQGDLQQLETLCYQFADKFDDFNEEWVPLNRISVELPQDIQNEDNFLRYTRFYEVSDSAYIYMVSIRDFRLRSATAPFEYVKNDIKRIIWNNRRIEFIKNLENGIYSDALKENKFREF